ELTGPEDEVARRDLVAERLADLRDTERQLLARRRLHILEVHEDALSGLGPQVRDRRVVLYRADVRLEHQVEASGLGEAVLRAAVGARSRLGQLVGAEALLAVAAVDERIGERADVAARLPHLGRHEDGGVEADDVVAILHHRAPPGVLHVALQEDAERPVVPGRAESSGDLRRWEHQAAPLGQVDHAVDQLRIRGPGHDGPGYSGSRALKEAPSSGGGARRGVRGPGSPGVRLRARPRWAVRPARR